MLDLAGVHRPADDLDLGHGAGGCPVVAEAEHDESGVAPEVEDRVAAGRPDQAGVGSYTSGGGQDPLRPRDFRSFATRLLVGSLSPQRRSPEKKSHRSTPAARLAAA